MKIERFYRSGTQHRSNVTLEDDIERALSDSDLLLIADNARGITFDKAAGSYRLNGEELGTARHFGGYVKRDGDRCTVTVYID